jgi:hypothetical protein
MSPTLDTRKPVEALTARDLEAFPVWAFVDDDGEDEEQDETWVQPVPSELIPRQALSLCVAAAARLPCGLVYPAVLFCDTYRGFKVSAAALLTVRGRSLFVPNDTLAERRKALAELGLTAAQVLPFDYCRRAPSADTGRFERGTFSSQNAA